MTSKITFGAAIAAFAALAAISAPAHAAFLYSSGPVNGTITSWNIANGFTVTDTFTLAAGGDLDTALFYTWDDPGATLTTIDWAITTAEFGGTTIASGSETPTEGLVFPAGGLTGFGAYDIYSNAISLGGVDLAPGSYYLQLGSGVVTDGGPAFWDENDGASTGYQTSTYFGTYATGTGGEAFNLYGGTYVPTPEASTYVGLLLGVAGLAAFGMMSARRRNDLSA